MDAGERSTVGIDENSVVMANQENSVGVVDGKNTEMIEEENTEMIEEENTEMIEEENTEMIEEENTEMIEEENTEMIEEENTEMVEEENTEMVDGEPANDTVRVEIDGARIVNISRLEQYINELTSHAAKCEKSAGSVVLVGERKDGLASIISTECSGCGHVVKLETSPKVAGPSGYNRWEINLAAVWGQMCTGGGHATLQESLGYVGVPVMTKKSFISTERTIGEWWRERLQQSMIQPNSVLVNVTNSMATTREKDRKRKSDDKYKESRRRKYERSEDTAQARRSYSRHDGGIEPEDVCEDLSLNNLKELVQRFYQTNVVLDNDKACLIEQKTKTQSDSAMWMEERKKRVTASKVGGIAKMRPGTKRAKKVEDMLYTRFSGSAATRYGVLMEEETRKQYVTYQQQHGHPGLETEEAGLCISCTNPWLAASPDGIVHDPISQPATGLLEIKNPHSARNITIREFASKASSCLNVQQNGTCYLKHGHDYYFQMQCQLYCADNDFVVRTNKDMHIERIYRDRDWWTLQMAKCKTFYFRALLPELACPRYGKGGIREPKNTTDTVHV